MTKQKLAGISTAFFNDKIPTSTAACSNLAELLCSKHGCFGPVCRTARNGQDTALSRAFQLVHAGRTPAPRGRHQFVGVGRGFGARGLPLWCWPEWCVCTPATSHTGSAVYFLG